MTFDLNNLKASNDVKTQGDSLGVGKFIFDSNIYNFTVIQAYLEIAKSGAAGLAVKLKDQDSGKELSETFWMTSGTEKGCKTYYEKDGEKFELAGFAMARHLAMLTVGKDISDLVPEDKLIKLYSYEAKGEVPTTVKMYTELLGKEITAGILKKVVDVNKLNDSTKKYEATGETKEVNEIDKLFRAADQFTVTELRAKAPAPTFIDTWRNQWAGKTKTVAKGVKAGNSGVAGFPSTAAANQGAAPAPAKSIFG